MVTAVRACPIAPEGGPGAARPPNAFWCNWQPKICTSVKDLPTRTKLPSKISMTFFPGNAHSNRVVSSSHPVQVRESHAIPNKYTLHFWSQLFHNGVVKSATLCSFASVNSSSWPTPTADSFPLNFSATEHEFYARMGQEPSMTPRSNALQFYY